MATIQNIMTKIKQLESEEQDKDKFCIWINDGEDHEVKIAAAQVQHPDKEILAMSWLYE